jgi:hypothetical protein
VVSEVRSGVGDRRRRRGGGGLRPKVTLLTRIGLGLSMSSLLVGAFVSMERRRTAGERARDWQGKNLNNTIESGIDQLKKRDLP